LFTAKEIEQESKLSIDVVNNLISAFALPNIPSNAKFGRVGEYNEAEPYPILQVKDGIFLLLQSYVLCKSCYETPFFWMLQDKSYKEIAAKNRGLFTEKFAQSKLQTVFGISHVFANVKIMRRKSIVGEIDVLVVYADRIIILQAKSKKMTEAALMGDDIHIGKDFYKAIQQSYNQGYKCAELIEDKSVYLIDSSCNKIILNQAIREIFLLCVISEHYPALMFQVGEFLSKKSTGKISNPFIIDIFFLDVFTEFLDNPLYLFSYLNRRVNLDVQIKTESEFDFLSYHLCHNLWFDKDQGAILIDSNFSYDLAIAFMSRREGCSGIETPEGILTRQAGTFYDQLLKKISDVEGDCVLDLGYLLLELSDTAAGEFARGCEFIMSQTIADGRDHDITLIYGYTGITVHSSVNADYQTRKRLWNHCFLAKYRQRTGQWYGLSLYPGKQELIRFVVKLEWPWKFDATMEGFVHGSQSHGAKSFEEAIRQSKLKSSLKVGVNEPCPCGSGKKYKKCCLIGGQ
jgi:SEC-C motif